MHKAGVPRVGVGPQKPAGIMTSDSGFIPPFEARDGRHVGRGPSFPVQDDLEPVRQAHDGPASLVAGFQSSSDKMTAVRFVILAHKQL